MSKQREKIKAPNDRPVRLKRAKTKALKSGVSKQTAMHDKEMLSQKLNDFNQKRNALKGYDAVEFQKEKAKKAAIDKRRKI